MTCDHVTFDHVTIGVEDAVSGQGGEWTGRGREGEARESHLRGV